MISKKSARSRTDEIRDFLITLLEAQRADPVGEAARVFRVSRQAINRHLRALVANGIIRASGATKGKRYSLVIERHTREYPTAGLKEDVVWRDFVRPSLGNLPENVLEVWQYGFTEMLNNAVEHSGGTQVTITVAKDGLNARVVIYDNGVGIFQKIRSSLGLEDDQHVVLELSKGKLTTDPEKHTGEGIFFTSRVFDRFGILSGELLLLHTPRNSDWVFETGQRITGTRIELCLQRSSSTRLGDLFDRFASSDRNYRFSITHVPVALARVGVDNLVSRSQARRLVARLDLFESVVLDFEGVQQVGQAFADEVFRVFASEHPRLRLSWVDANDQVTKMILRAVAAREQQSGPPGI
jgi:anti-sigma regulatory factor (Ser/Thr protein kinase)